jgi:nucleotide-binding universal stress UspA family protein
MLIFHRILCPVDFDDNWLAALSLGAQLAERDHATLYLIHVIRIAEEATVTAPAVIERDERTTLLRQRGGEGSAGIGLSRADRQNGCAPSETSMSGV